MFQIHRIFCATPWEMEAERRRFYDLIGHFNETVAMKSGVLFVPLTLPNVADKRPLQYAMGQNIRDCRHYILLTAEDWGPPQRNFREEYREALRAIDDPASPMKSAAVLAKELADGEPRSESLPEAQATFSSLAEFDECVNGLLSGWLESLVSTERAEVAAG